MSLFHILYVESPAASTAFYEKLFGRPPLESAPTFALFALQEGVKLGLWARQGVVPASAAGAGGGELALAVPTHGEVDRRHGVWQQLGVTIAQPPTDLDFGRSFVGLDPDGHRLRIMCLNAQ